MYDNSDNPAADLSAAVVAASTEALTALRTLRSALEAADLPRAARPDLADLAEELSRVDTAAVRAVERYELSAAGMVGEPRWDTLGDRYTAADPAWAVEVVGADERCPTLTLRAPSAPEANRRAVTYAEHTLGLADPVPIDGPRQRLDGVGTAEVSPGRWRVTVEGW